jgi:hypothetical protein
MAEAVIWIVLANLIAAFNMEQVRDKEGNVVFDFDASTWHMSVTIPISLHQEKLTS